MLRLLKYAGLKIRAIFVVLPLLSFLLAALIVGFPSITHIFVEARWMGLLLVLTAAWLWLLEHYGVTRLEELFATKAGLRNVLAASLGYTISLALLLFFFHPALPAQRRLVVVAGTLLFLMNCVARLALRASLRRSHPPLRILIVGADSFARVAAQSLSAGSVLPCKVVAFVRLPGQNATQCEDRVVEFSELRSMFSAADLDEIIIAAPPDHFQGVPSMVEQLEPLCVPVRAILDFGENIFTRDRIFSFSGLHMLDLHRYPSESMRYMVMKRAFDIGFSLLALVLAAPLIALIALAVKLTSQGPVLFVQKRVGLNGKLFNMYKFRTMEVCGQAESDTQWTVPQDKRCTPIGKFLRRTSLDELPQFYNALKGDMSVVGPRPERPHFVQKFLHQMDDYNVRHSLKVGITGWAQVNGWRGDTEITKRVEYDLYYLRNWSLGFDMQIVALTLFKGLLNRNAY